QAITTLKKGSYLLKYGRRGKPKFCPFQLSSDESTLIWYSGKDEKQLKLCQVTKIIPGQRTAIFHRYPRPEKEYQSFSLIYGDRSLDLICKDKDEADVWFVGLKALITHGNYNRKWRIDTRTESTPSESPYSRTRRCSPSVTPFVRDVFIWGEGSVDGALGCGVHRVGNPSIPKSYALLPKALESTVVLDVYRIACGSNHAALVTRHGEIFSWGQGLGGRLGHGKEVDVPLPTLIDGLSGMNVDVIACGEYHTCAVTLSGDLYTWGDGTHNYGLLGHGSEVSHWVPKRVSSNIEATYVSSVSCGPWHTAAVTSSGQLFTFGDGTFGTLGHGDRISTSVPREVESLRGMRVKKVACGLWHTAVVAEEVITDPLSGEVSAGPSSGKLFTWGNGDEGCLGHGDENPRLVPEQVVTLVDENICQVACGHNLTVVLTILGQVYTMGSSTYGQLGCPKANGKLPNLVKVFCKACSTRKSLKASLAPSTNKPYRVCDDCYYKLKKVLESNHQSSHTPKARTGNNPDKSIDMMEKETVLPRLLSQYSKLSTIDAIHGSKTWQSKHSSKKRLRNSRVFPVITANLQSLELSHFKVPTIAQGSLKKPLQRNLPSSSVCLRTPIIIDDTRNMNVTYSEEIQRLREQVNIVELINFSSFIFINSYAFFN
ncbi:unnamed protein product, partial [Linum tenue]